MAATLACLLAATACAPDAPPAGPPELQPALAAVGAKGIARHLQRLASDEFAGRGTGTGGYRAAAGYVATRLDEYGLDPAGAGSDFYQPVPLLRADALPDESSLTLLRDGSRVQLESGRDYLLAPDFRREAAELTAPVIYAGFGVTAPDLGWDDYAGLDVRDKIVAVFSGGPASFPGDLRAYHGSRREKLRAAVDHGATGVLLLRDDREEARAPWERVVRQGAMGAMRWVGDDGRPQNVERELFVEAVLSRSGLEKLFEGSRPTLDETLRRLQAGPASGFELPAPLAARTASRQAPLDSSNVVALLRGGDPALAEETVVLMAHLDHLGSGEPVDGDAIYNGAYDNASGVAVLLEVARALASLDVRPRRSILFLALTAQERGMLGSDYFARHPTVDSRGIVAGVNLDGVLMLHPLREVVGYGADHSTLAAALAAAAQESGLTVVPDPVPEEGVFVRSDHYSFVRQGTPALLVAPGLGGDDAGAGARRWQREVYHTPKDDLDQSFDFEAGAAFARLVVRLIWGLAQADDRPAWNPDDFFGRSFGPPATVAPVP